MQRVMLLLLLISGCTLGTRPLTPHEQAVVRDMAREYDPKIADRVTWRVKRDSEWSHAPAMARATGRTIIILYSGFSFDPSNNADRTVLWHELVHAEQSWREGFWWPIKYVLASKRYEDEAWAVARKRMEARHGDR